MSSLFSCNMSGMLHFLYFHSGPNIGVSVTRTELCYKDLLVMLAVDSDRQG